MCYKIVGGVGLKDTVKVCLGGMGINLSDGVRRGIEEWL